MVYRHDSDSLAFDTNGGEKLRITSDGDVGIGTTNPSEKLDVNGSLRVTTTDGTERFRVDSSSNFGRVGIGSTQPTQRLDVAGNIALNQTTVIGSATASLHYNISNCNSFWNINLNISFCRIYHSGNTRNKLPCHKDTCTS